jgi:SARP family transcriptional regulator, regulator of embCAB operon
VYISVLGPLSVRHGTVELAPMARKPCTVLALLLLNQGRVVSVPALVDELWQEVPPRTARAALRIYVSQLRKQLARTVAETMLRTVPNGYRFVVDPGQFDLAVYHRLGRAGRDALAVGDFPLAAKHFRQALDLWRGPPVADVVPGNRIRAEVAGLTQSRLTMLDYRIEVELRLGRHRELLDELAVSTARDRFHETSHAQYVIALYRSGYRVRALEACHRLRQDLRDEFGLDLSPELKEIYQAVLTEDPALDETEVVPLRRGDQVALPGAM